MSTEPDDVYADRSSKWQVLDENGKQLSKDSIVVFERYKEPLQNTESTATLLVNSKLREQYVNLHAEKQGAKEALIKALKKQSSCKNPEEEIALSFRGATGDDEFWTALTFLEAVIPASADIPYAKLDYGIAFDPRALEFLNEADVKTALDEYLKKYNELISESVYFRKDTFEYYNGSSIAKHLDEQGFFKAKHYVILDGTTKREIKGRKDLEELINLEKQKIAENADLRGRFEKIDLKLIANKAIRDFRTLIMNDEAILSQLSNPTKFKQDCWISYLRANVPLYTDLMSKYKEAEAKSKSILQEAQRETTQWESVIETFNDRFLVPFKLTIKNRDAAIFGGAAPLLGYTFEDGESKAVERDQLLRVLSQGEGRALYVLDILFDVQIRKMNAQETLFVVDDIADSFDYRNKYSIIQYLDDMAREPLFKLLILTHNFDFFRTVSRRFVGYKQCLMAAKSDTEITINDGKGINNPFVIDWKGQFFNDARKRVASISFMRNLIEFTQSKTAPDFLALTSLLHWKKDTPTIRQKDLDEIYLRLFMNAAGAWARPNESVIDMIQQEADSCVQEKLGAEIAHKIVLSIAIRIAADRFMINKINNPAQTDAFEENPTRELFNIFEAAFSSESNSIKILRKVLLMTPENIHLNAFMYEPIVDMSEDHLKILYNEVKALK
jgi:hypothetical protein